MLKLAVLQPIDAPVPGYLIQTDDGKNILIDTGFAYSTIANPYELPGGLLPLMTEPDYVVNQLENIGLRPEDIDILVCTHFDTDHAGNHEIFTNAELVVQRSHYELARTGHERFAGIRKNWDASGLRYRLIDGDMVLVPDVELIETSGHVPGHQSVLVRLPQTGTVILAIDAIPHSSMIDPDNRVIHPLDMDERTTRESTRKLVELARRENSSFIIHGHDAQQWAELKLAPNFYD